MTNYYDVNLKNARQKLLCENLDFYNYNGLVQDTKLLNEIYSLHKPNIFIHLAAQAGVRYVKKNPDAYFESNIRGFFNIIEFMF